MSDKAVDLYQLLPAVYRMRDAEQGYPLRALLEIVAEQVDILKRDVDGLWDDLFIETCADWVIPYIGDLVGNNPLYEIIQGRRADVAKTISYRRRKGVLPMLEELARDVTNWGAHAVAAFENLGWTQNVNHLRYTTAANPDHRFPHAIGRVGTVNLREMDAADRLDGPFDTLCHTVDVRPADQRVGRHNIRKINFFLWRLSQFPMTGVPARRSGSFSRGFYFSPLGNPAPLFTNPEREAAADQLATELHVPGPIRPAAFYFRPADFYGPGKSLAIYRGPTADPLDLVPLSEIVCQDLSTWGDPPAGKVAVDVRHGRIAFPAGIAPRAVTVDMTYGFSAEMGGGPYDRKESLAAGRRGLVLIQVGKQLPNRTLQDGLNEWEVTHSKAPAVIQIVDNGVYGGLFNIQLPADGKLVIEAKNGFRPVVLPVGQPVLSAPAGDAELTLNGLLIGGALRLKGDLKLTLAHCTLVPGRLLREDGRPRFPDLDSLTLVGSRSADLAVTIDKSITGPLRLPADCESLTIRDSMVQGLPVGHLPQPAIAANDEATRPGPPTTAERSTFWGEVYVKELTASECIFDGQVRAARRQNGCVRLSFVPDGSTTPRRYRCQPDLALDKAPAAQHTAILACLRPSYTSTHYGDPGYGQLGHDCPDEIRTGAADGSEMGAFCSLMQPQRETNLRIRLEEYLPFGLEPGIIYVT